MRDGMRATYSRKAVSKKTEIKNDEKSVTEEVGLFHFVLIFSYCHFIPFFLDSRKMLLEAIWR
jgi:hypothetical protein